LTLYTEQAACRAAERSLANKDPYFRDIATVPQSEEAFVSTVLERTTGKISSFM
jgi:hypothetical protein